MSKNPMGKAMNKKKRAEKTRERTAAKYAARSAKNGSSNGPTKVNRHPGLAVPAKRMEQMSNEVLETIFLNQEPGWRLAERILDKRYKQADEFRSRMHVQQFPQATAA